MAGKNHFFISFLHYQTQLMSSFAIEGKFDYDMARVVMLNTLWVRRKKIKCSSSEIQILKIHPVKTQTH